MENQENRKCNFVSVATFVDKNGNIKSFERKGGSGLLSYDFDETDCPHAWSDIWRIYKTPKFGKTLSALNEEELYNYKSEQKNNKSSLELFVEWYSKNY
jgi:hypothetical protein